jgi:single-stranded DNA-binding protein
MSIEVAFYGFCAADAEPRTSQAGKSWTRLRVGVAVFGKAAEKAAELKKTERVYIEGTIKLDSWRGNDGIERHGLSVAAFKCEPTHRIGRNKPDRKKNDRKSESAPAASNNGAELDDEIPF